MSWVEFEATIPVFKRAKTVHSLDRAAIVMACETSTDVNFEKARLMKKKILRNIVFDNSD
jgi:hypothetical protein